MTSDDSGDTKPKSSADLAILTPEVLQAMRKAGLPKPEGVSWGAWMGPRKLNQRHEMVALWAAYGKSNNQICQEMGFTPARMSVILQAPRMVARVAELRKQLHGESVQARFQKLADKGLQVVENILNDGTLPARTRLTAAQDMLNRAHGKPKETLEVRTGSIRDIFEYMDRMKAERQPQLEVVEKTEELTEKTEPAIIDVESELVSSENKDASSQQSQRTRRDIDSWIESNVPKGAGFGQGDPKK